MTHEDILERRIRNALPKPEIVAALNDDITHTGILDQCPDAYVGPPLFNAATSAMNILRRDPDAQVVEKPVKIPEGAGLLLRSLGRILNDSRERKTFKGSEFRFTSLRMKKVGSSALAEERFYEAVESTGDDVADMDREPSTLYVRTDGTPVLLQKEAGEKSALAFKQIILNKIRYPAGTLFNIEENPRAVSLSVNNLTILPAKQASIDGIAPLRFSPLMLPLPERHAATEGASEYYLPDQDTMQTLRTMTLSNILEKLPSPRTIFLAMQQSRISLFR